MTWLDCTIQNRNMRFACAYNWVHNNKYSRRFSSLSAHLKKKILLCFYNHIYRAQNNSFCESKITIY